jgi:hypothetical protein
MVKKMSRAGRASMRPARQATVKIESPIPIRIIPQLIYL